MPAAPPGPSDARGPYSDVIRQRWRRPRFRGDLPDANAVAEDVNPLCGDRVRMLVRVDDARVTATRFTGDSCAICAASADVLAELATGRSVSEVAALTVGDVIGILDADIRPTRMRCATLPLDVLRLALASPGASRGRDGASR
jgi:nitrogen fixation NifU-like protein